MPNKPIIHIFEPHGDDALISCWPLLRNLKNRIEIVTMGMSRSSEGLLKHFPNITAAYYLQCFEIHMKYRAAYKNDYLKWAKTSVGEGRLLCLPQTPYEWQETVTMVANGELWKESYSETLEKAREYLRVNTNPGDIVFSPVGLLHPYHICLAAAMEQIRNEFRCGDQRLAVSRLLFGLYVDYPYASGAWVKNILATHPLSGKGYTQAICETDDPALKEKIFRDVYPTEVGIFRFTRDEVLRPTYAFYGPKFDFNTLLDIL